MDLARYALTSQGEQIHIAAWPAGSAVSHDPSSGVFDDLTEAAARHHAAAGQCFVINVQSCIDSATVKDLGFEGRPEMVREGGGWTAIIAPTGQILAGPNRDKETILHAELDLSLIAHFKYVSDAAGHYARPDVLQLLVNFEPQRNMTSLAPAKVSSEHGQLSAPGEQRSEIGPSTLEDLSEAKEPQVQARQH